MSFHLVGLVLLFLPCFLKVKEVGLHALQHMCPEQPTRTSSTLFK